MRAIWFIHDPEFGYLLVSRKIKVILNNRLVYTEGRIFKKHYTLSSQHNITNYMIPLYNGVLILMQQTDNDQLIPLNINNDNRDIVEIAYNVLNAQDTMYKNKINTLKRVIDDFIKNEYQNKENTLIWIRKIFNHTSRFFDIACSMIDISLDFIESKIGTEISEIDTRILKETLIEKLREEIGAVKEPEDIVTMPLLRSTRLQEVLNKHDMIPDNKGSKKEKSKKKSKKKHSESKDTSYTSLNIFNNNEDTSPPGIGQGSISTTGNDYKESGNEKVETVKMSDMSSDDWLDFARQITGMSEDEGGGGDDNDQPPISFEDTGEE